MRQENILRKEPSFIEEGGETEEAAVEALEEALSADSTTKINEGNNGVILKIRKDGVSPEARHYLLDEEDQGETTVGDPAVAAKLLKIYTGTAGRQEYQMQKMAWSVINQSTIKGIKVPKPERFHEIEIHGKKTERNLRSMGISFSDQKILEIITMELVDGKDLARIMYEEYIRKHADKFQEAYPDIENVDLFLEQLDMDQLMSLYHRFVGAPKHRNDDMSPEAMRERNSNAKKLIEELSYLGILQKGQVENLKQGILALNKAGIYHGDLHPRNIMIGRDGNVYIVDFGAAREDSPGLLNDLGVVNSIVNLAKTPDDRNKELDEMSLVEPERLRQALTRKGGKKWDSFIKNVVKVEDVISICVAYAIELGYEKKNLVALLIEAAERGRKEEVVLYAKQEMNREEKKKKPDQNPEAIKYLRSIILRYR